jgi:hypothetical protein
MQVFLIPIGPDTYEPYFEPVDVADEAGDGEAGGWLSRQRRKLTDMLREAEAERHRRHDPTAEAAGGFVARWRRKSMRWIVERAAEQRLLWHLRTATAVTLVAPDDLTADEALAILRQGLKRDSDRHLRWFLVNLVGLIVSVALILVPGPNALGYYFTFTTVGHLLAWRGAQQGLRRVQWQVEPNAAMTDLRAALTMTSPAREDRLHDVAGRLGLRHLATFVERLAVPPA